MVYNFFTDKTAGPIINFLNQSFSNVRLLEYSVIDFKSPKFKSLNPKSDNSEVKEFKFGASGVDELLILWIYKDDSVKTQSGLWSRPDVMNLKSYLTQFVRDFRINQII